MRIEGDQRRSGATDEAPSRGEAALRRGRARGAAEWTNLRRTYLLLRKQIEDLRNGGAPGTATWRGVRPNGRGLGFVFPDESPESPASKEAVVPRLLLLLATLLTSLLLLPQSPVSAGVQPVTAAVVDHSGLTCRTIGRSPVRPSRSQASGWSVPLESTVREAPRRMGVSHMTIRDRPSIRFVGWVVLLRYQGLHGGRPAETPLASKKTKEASQPCSPSPRMPLL